MTLAGDVDLSALAAHPRLLGASGATLIGVCRDAAFAALREAIAEDRLEDSNRRQDSGPTAINVAARHFETALPKACS